MEGKELGEVLKVLKETKLGGSNFLIEQNAPVSEQGERIIHIQNEKFRLEMPEQEFLRMASAFAYARRNLDFLKGLNKT